MTRINADKTMKFTLSAAIGVIRGCIRGSGICASFKEIDR